MRVDLFDFELPEDRIALRPAEPRDAARLLVVRPKQVFEDRSVRDLPELLRPGDALVLNDTKVIPSRLFGLRSRGETAARVEIMLHKRDGTDLWRAFARPAKRLQPGDRIRFGEESESLACELGRLDAEVVEKGRRRGPAALRLRRSGSRRGDRPVRRHAAAALYRRPPRPGRRTGRLSDDLRPRRRRRRRADRRAALHGRAVRAAPISAA